MHMLSADQQLFLNQPMRIQHLPPDNAGPCMGIANECQLDNIFSTPTNENLALPISQKCSFQPVLWFRLDPNLTNADQVTAFYLNVDLNPDPAGSQTNADPCRSGS
jgi:hypothetical protein